MCRECGELLYGRRFPLKPKEALMGDMYGLEFCIDVKHGAWNKMRWKFYEGQRYIW